MPDLDALTIAAIALAFAGGGVVKGVVGFGQPIVVVAVLTHFMPVATILGLSVVPMSAANVWQAWGAGNPLRPAGRLWPLLAGLMVTTWFATGLVLRLDQRTLFAVVGGAIVLFVAASLARPGARIAAAFERPAGAVAGALGGLIGGMTSVFGPPIVMYLVLIRLDKDEMVQALSLVWMCAMIPFIGGMIQNGVLTAELALSSVAACVPVLAGVALGEAVRRRVNQAVFRKVLLGTLLVVGLNLIRRAWM